MENGWSEDLATNIPWIDTQHKNIIARINDFLSAVSQGRGQKEIAAAVKVLEEFVNTHFETEEKYMLQYKYPHYKQHQTQHKNYTKVVESLTMEYEIQVFSADYVKKVKTVLYSYLQDHIIKFDKPLAIFLKGIKKTSL